MQTVVVHLSVYSVTVDAAHDYINSGNGRTNGSDSERVSMWSALCISLTSSRSPDCWCGSARESHGCMRRGMEGRG